MTLGSTGGVRRGTDSRGEPGVAPACREHFLSFRPEWRNLLVFLLSSANDAQKCLEMSRLRST